MIQRRHIIIFGNSIIVGTVGASLRCASIYDITHLSLEQIDELEAMAPDVVIFDLDSPRPRAAFTLLDTLPGLKLIGISADSNVVKVWSGRLLRELSTKDLLGVIHSQPKKYVCRDI